MVVRKPCAKDANPNPEEGKVDGEVEEVEKVDGEEVEEGASVAAERVRSRVKESPVAKEGDEGRAIKWDLITMMMNKLKLLINFINNK